MADTNKYLAIGTDDIELNFSGGVLDDGSLNIVIAALKGSSGSAVFTLDSEFIADLLNNAPVGKDAFAALADLVPDGLKIGLNSALLIVSRNAGSTRLILGASFGASINLSALPMVDKVFPPDQTLGVDNFQVVLSSAQLSQTEADGAVLSFGWHGVPCVVPRFVAPGVGAAGLSFLVQLLFRRRRNRFGVMS